MEPLVYRDSHVNAQQWFTIHIILQRSGVPDLRNHLDLSGHIHLVLFSYFIYNESSRFYRLGTNYERLQIY